MKKVEEVVEEAKSPQDLKGTKRKRKSKAPHVSLDVDELKLSSRLRSKQKKEVRYNVLESRSVSISKDGLRLRKRPTARNIRRQEHQKSFKSPRGLSPKNRTTFQPRKQYH